MSNPIIAPHPIIAASPIIAALRMVRAGKNRVLGNRCFTRRAREGVGPIPVLFYHRVADDDLTPLTLPSKIFEWQIDFCSRYFEVISLAEIQDRIANRRSVRRAVGLTFDDGYADNSRSALPLIVRRGLPCTYFVTVDPIVRGQPFPHDQQLQSPPLPHTVDELRDWADAGIEMGLHTRSHWDFANGDDPATIEREIVTAADELADFVHRPVRYFAFPYGLPPQLSGNVIDTLRARGMKGYCSAYGAYNIPGRDPFHIRRIHGDLEYSRFLNWMYFDPKKIDRDLMLEADVVSPSR